MYALEAAEARDLPRIMLIAGNALTERYDDAFFLSMIELGEPTFLVARDLGSDEVVGFTLAVRSTPFEGRVLLLATDDNHRGRGLGGRMLKEVERRMRRLGVIGCDLEVRDDNMSAIAFYHRAGYEIQRALPSFYEDGGRALMMSKGL